MIGLSPLSTGHPPSFQPRWVRPSTGSYPRFSLPMDSSPGSLRLAFQLNLAADRNSLAHSTKGTPSHPGGGAPTACRHTVSGTISLPSRGAFHLSLTVLVHYRSRRVVPPASHRVSRVRQYSGTGRQSESIRVRGSNPVSPAFPGRSASSRFCNCATTGPTTPAALAQPPVWPRSPFARHY